MYQYLHLWAATSAGEQEMMLLYDQVWVPSAGLALVEEREQGDVYNLRGGSLICNSRWSFHRTGVWTGHTIDVRSGRGGGIRLRGVGLGCFWASFFQFLGLIEGNKQQQPAVNLAPTFDVTTGEWLWL